MGEEPVIASLLETEEGLELLNHHVLEDTPDTGYGERQAYRQFRNKTLGKRRKTDLPGYIDSANQLTEQPLEAYRQGLLKPEVAEEIDRHLNLLRENRERTLNLSEKEAVVSTAMKEQVVPRQALDKEELLDRMYIAVYSSAAELPESAFSEYDEHVA